MFLGYFCYIESNRFGYKNVVIFNIHKQSTPNSKNLSECGKQSTKRGGEKSLSWTYCVGCTVLIIF